MWADEIFSLAMATGHSLEHPAVEANPALGDFMEPGPAQSPITFQNYIYARECVSLHWYLVLHPLLGADDVSGDVIVAGLYYA